jgi:hypothetical protein
MLWYMWVLLERQWKCTKLLVVAAAAAMLR